MLMKHAYLHKKIGEQCSEMSIMLPRVGSALLQAPKSASLKSCPSLLNTHAVLECSFTIFAALVKEIVSDVVATIRNTSIVTSKLAQIGKRYSNHEDGILGL